MHAGEITKRARRFLGEPSLEIEMKSEWRSQAPGYREKIRRHIYDSYCQDETVLDLKSPPVLKNGAVSISHGKTIGGFAFVSHKGPIGFDIEEHRRLHDGNVKGFSASKDEESAAPTVSALWTAKEAAFKFLYKTGQQPLVVREIEIGNWQTVDTDVHTCRIIKLRDQDTAELKSTAKGLVILEKNEAIAIFVEPRKL